MKHGFRLVACLLLAACGNVPNPAAPLVTEGPLTTVPWPGTVIPGVTPPMPRVAAMPEPSPPDAVAEVGAGPGCRSDGLSPTQRAICGSPTALWLDRQLDGIQGWKTAGPAAVGRAETDAMRLAVRRWIGQCGADIACIQSRQLGMLRTLTASIDAARWGGRYDGPHWTMYVLPAQYVGEVNVFFTLDHNGRECALALTGVRLDLHDRFPLPDLRAGAIGGSDRLYLADPDNPSALIRFTRVGSKVWINRDGRTPALDRQCRAGAIYGEYRKDDARKPLVSYLGAPGLEPLPPHIMVPGA
ncbi:hypothetical protein [Inquilinus sp. Marseille-Q2685]|uniref:hypothetical protein n=1 Tax=Inquilinus sp. Marseille-Q2685 TaxID=2866581 RepID=UPI001CE4136A|nr:hypothetical protein [Inquilinus sp. Marseille-Q2685]